MRLAAEKASRDIWKYSGTGGTGEDFQRHHRPMDEITTIHPHRVNILVVYGSKMRQLAAVYSVTPVPNPMDYVDAINRSVSEVKLVRATMMLRSNNNPTSSHQQGPDGTSLQKKRTNSYVSVDRLDALLAPKLTGASGTALLSAMWNHTSKFCRINANIALLFRDESTSHLWNMVR